MSARLLAVGGVIVAVTATVVFLATQVVAGGSDQAVRLVPADAQLYATARWDPSLGQLMELRDIAEEVGAGDAVSSAGDAFRNGLDDGLARAGLTFEDIEPLIGRQAAVFLSDIDVAQLEASATQPLQGSQPPVAGAALLAVTDEEEALRTVESAADAQGETVERRESPDGDYLLIPDPGGQLPIGYTAVEGFLVVGTESAVEATLATAAGGASLADQETFAATAGRLPEDHLIGAWIDNEAFASSLSSAGLGAGTSLPGVTGQTAMTLHVDDGALFVDTASTSTEDAQSFALQGDSPLPTLPETTIVGLALPEIGPYATSVLDALPQDMTAQPLPPPFEGLDLREDVLGWMGEATLHVRGREVAGLGGGLAVDTSDPQATRTVVDRLADFAYQQGSVPSAVARGGADGYVVSEGGVDVEVLVGDEQLTVDVAQPQGTAPQGTLGESEAYQAAVDRLGGEWTPSAYLDLPTILDIVEAEGGNPATTEDEQRVYDGVREIDAIVAGQRTEGDVLLQRAVLPVVD